MSWNADHLFAMDLSRRASKLSYLFSQLSGVNVVFVQQIAISALTAIQHFVEKRHWAVHVSPLPDNTAGVLI